MKLQNLVYTFERRKKKQSEIIESLCNNYSQDLPKGGPYYMSGDIPTRCPAEFFRLFVMVKGI